MSETTLNSKEVCVCVCILQKYELLIGQASLSFLPFSSFFSFLANLITTSLKTLIVCV